MKRLTTIDILRGFSMFIMITGHYQFWWVKESQVFIIESIYWFYSFVTAGFLFLSGISTSISNRKRLAKIDETYTEKRYRNEYLIRVFLIFILALINNVVVTIVLGDLSDLWKWFFLLTLSFSLLFAWPLLKLSKRSRIIIVILIWAADQLIVLFLYDFKGQINLFGIIYHILYNSIDQDPILTFFPYLLIGTVIGDILFDIFEEEEKEKRIQIFKKKFLFPSLLIGMTLITPAILFNYPFFLYRGVYEWMRPLPDFLNRGTISWMILTLGVCITVFTILLAFEIYEVFTPKKRYNFFFYFSYYSFVIYLVHNIFYFLFLGILDAYLAIIFSIITLVFYGLLLKFLFKKYGSKVSLKVIIGRLSVVFAQKIEDKKK